MKKRFISKVVSIVVALSFVLAMFPPGLAVQATETFQTEPIVSAGSFYTVALKSDGTVWAWGLNSHGQLGNETTANQSSVPLQVKGLSDVTEVSAGNNIVGNNHTLAVKSDGTVWAWGYNSDGQLGNGTTDESNVPVQVMNLTNVISVAAGNLCSLALKSDGTVWTWGKNGFGQLGNGTTTNSLVPVQVYGLTDTISISAGSGYSLALKSNGTVWAWGKNGLGELGNGTTDNSNVPVQVTDLADVSAISASNDHTLAVKGDGTVWGWGSNSYYKLGDAIPKGNYCTVPIQVTNLTNILAVAAGGQNSLAVKSNGAVWAWGLKNGESVNGIIPSVGVPEQVVDLIDVNSVSAGYNYSLAVKNDGTVWSWGSDSNGQLGNGKTSTSNVPVQVVGENGEGYFNVYGTSDPTTNLSTSTQSSGTVKINALKYDKIYGYIKGASVELDSLGNGTTGDDGSLTLTNTVTGSISEKKMLTVKADGYRDYIGDIEIYGNNIDLLFGTSNHTAFLRPLKTGDDTKPYISTLMYYPKYSAETTNLMNIKETFSKNGEKSADMAMYAIWNGKTPAKYVLYQESGATLTSTDGKFSEKLGSVFKANETIYAKVIASDGTESSAEKTMIEISGSYPSSSSGQDEYINLFPAATSSLPSDTPFLGDMELSLDLAVPVTFTVKEDKIRLAVGIDVGETGYENVFYGDEEWEAWKKIYESAFTQNFTTSQWAKAVKNDLDLNWTDSFSFDSEVKGYFEISLKDEESSEGGIILTSDANVGTQAQYAIGPVPVYLKFGAGVSFSAGISGGYSFTEEKFYGDLTGAIEPYLSAEGGVGVLYVATVGAEGKASLPTKLDITNGLKSMDLAGQLSITASVLCFEYKHSIPEATWPLYPAASTGKASASSSLYASDNYSLIGREYSNTESVWYGDSTNATARTLSLATEKLLQSNTYPYAEPEINAVGDTYVATWLSDNIMRTSANRTMLVYSVYNVSTGNWSAPTAVSDDGTADFYPSVAVSGDNLFITWQNIAKRYSDDDASLENFTASSEIAVAKFNYASKRFINARRVTTNSSLDMAPTLAVSSDGSASVIWVTNSENDLYGINGTNTIMCANLSNISAISEVKSESGVIASMDAAYVNGKLTIAYCLDKDSNLTTVDDREIYTITNLTDLKQITKNDTLDSNPKYGLYKGEQALFWYSNSTIYAMLNDGSIKEIYNDESATMTDDFSLMYSDSGYSGVIWTSIQEDDSRQIEGVIYNKDSGTWSKDIVISSSSANVNYPSGAILDNGTMRIMYNRITGEDDTAQSDLCVMDLVPYYDLSIENVNYDEADLIPNTNVPVHVSIKNNGYLPVDSITVNVGGKQSVINERLEPGETTEVTAYYSMGSTVKNETININVGIKNGTDSNTADNARELNWGYTDAALNMQDLILENSHIAVIELINESYISSNCTLTIRSNSKDGDIIESIDLGTLSNQEMQVVRYSVSNSITKDIGGLEAIYFVVESDDDEIYCSNNYDFIVFESGENEAATYTITAAAGTGGSISPSGSVSVSEGESQTFTITPNSGYKISSVTVDGTSVGAISTYTFDNVTGNHSIRAEFVIITPELNTTNNTAYINGYEDGKVRPEAQITREEVALIFYRLLTEESRAYFETSTNNFSDVYSDRWSNTAISTLANAGVLNGYEDGTFKPGNPILRAELVKIVATLEDLSGENLNNPFTDLSIHWAKSYILSAANEGWITGYEDGTFRPDKNISRAEAMSIVNRVLGREDSDISKISDMKTWSDNADTSKWYYKAVQIATNSY